MITKKEKKHIAWLKERIRVKKQTLKLDKVYLKQCLARAKAGKKLK